jgi:hypothetical protein
MSGSSLPLPQDIGYVEPGSDGVAEYLVGLPADGNNYVLSLSAYDFSGNISDRSNAIVVAGIADGGSGGSGGTDPPMGGDGGGVVDPGGTEPNQPPAPTTEEPTPGQQIYFEDFESYAVQADPVDWLDTQPENSMSPDDSLFETLPLADGSLAFGTQSEDRNIHSHYVGEGAQSFGAYAFSGRMLRTEPDGSMGVTFLSDYPNSDEYYRLRSSGGGTFYIAPHKHKVRTCEGTTDSGVPMDVNTWYWFRVRVDASGTETRVQARV